MEVFSPGGKNAAEDMFHVDSSLSTLMGNSNRTLHSLFYLWEMLCPIQSSLIRFCLKKIDLLLAPKPPPVWRAVALLVSGL